MNSSNIDIKKIGSLVFGLLMVFLAFVVLVKSGVGSVKRLYDELQTERKDIGIIRDNISTLKKIDLALVSKTDQVYIAMPDRSLVPLLISNLKTVGGDKFKTETVRSDPVKGKEDIEGLSLIYEGSTADIETMLNIIETIQNYAPLTVVDKLEVKESPPEYKIELRLSTFWSQLPKELPQLDDVVRDLTDEETKVMNEVSQFKRPSSSNLDPQGPVDRANPFI